MKELTKLDINLKIAQEDVLMVVSEHLTNIQQDIEIKILETFKSFDYKSKIKEQVQIELDRKITEIISNYIRRGKGNDILTNFIENLIYDSVIEKISK